MKSRALVIGTIVLVVGVLVWANWRSAPLAGDAHADRVLVEKSARRLTLYRGDTPLKTYRVALGRQPVGAKSREGDQRTPEGVYVIDERLPKSAFHLALHVSYPSGRDREAARSAGVDPGGAIMIHGLHNGLGWVGRLHRLLDWTSGCIAVTNGEIEEIWRAVPDGSPVEIKQ
jgi:murein L,D-transpeptidase YafK